LIPYRYVNYFNKLKFYSVKRKSVHVLVIIENLVVLLITVKLLFYNRSTYLYNTATFITVPNYIACDEIRSENFNFFNVSSRIFV